MINNIAKFLLRCKSRQKDILVYEYENENEFIVHYDFHLNEWRVYDLHTSTKIDDQNVLDKLLFATEILCEYQHDNLIVLQVHFKEE